MRINKTPRFFLERVQELNATKSVPYTYPNLFPLARVGQIKWLSDDDHKKRKKTLLEKETVVIS
jgi:hypothetical protein